MLFLLINRPVFSFFHSLLCISQPLSFYFHCMLLPVCACRPTPTPCPIPAMAPLLSCGDRSDKICRFFHSSLCWWPCVLNNATGCRRNEVSFPKCLCRMDSLMAMKKASSLTLHVGRKHEKYSPLLVLFHWVCRKLVVLRIQLLVHVSLKLPRSCSVGRRREQSTSHTQAEPVKMIRLGAVVPFRRHGRKKTPPKHPRRGGRKYWSIVCPQLWSRGLMGGGRYPALLAGGEMALGKQLQLWFLLTSISIAVTAFLLSAGDKDYLQYNWSQQA